MSDSRSHVSIIIPIYNRGSFLAEAIESILEQNYQPLEIIIVDDGSTDNTAAVAASFGPKVLYVYQPNTGPAAARNHGLKIASGKIIGFLDSDDLWPTNKLKLQLPCFEENVSIEVVLGHTQRMIRRNLPKGKPTFTEYRNPVRLYSLGSALFRRSVFDKVGMFDENMYFSEDEDWFMRAEELNIPMLFLQDVTQYYRFHENNMTYDKPARTPYLLRLVKNRLDRQRDPNVQASRPANVDTLSGKAD